MTKLTVARAYLFLGAIEATAAIAAFLFVMKAHGWQWGDMPGAGDPGYLQATTACLAAIVVMQVVNVFLCRHPTRSVFAMDLACNPLLLWGIALELGLIALIAFMPWGNAIFGTAPIGIEAFAAAHPDVPILTAAIDRELNDHAYIVPGLGDAGDRMYGTK